MESQSHQPNRAHFEYLQDQWFNLPLVIMMNIFGIALSLSLIFGGVIIGFTVASIGSAQDNLPLAIIGILLIIFSIPLYFLLTPTTQLNPFLCWKARSKKAPVAESGEEFVCQVSFTPRLQKGLQVALDDADDIGVLTVGQQGMHFHGGFCRFSIPFQCVTSMEGKFNLFPGFLLSGRRMVLYYTSDAGEGKLEVENRQGITVIDQFMRSLTLIKTFRSRLPNAPYVSKFI